VGLSLPRWPRVRFDTGPDDHGPRRRGVPRLGRCRRCWSESRRQGRSRDRGSGRRRRCGRHPHLLRCEPAQQHAWWFDAGEAPGDLGQAVALVDDADRNGAGISSAW